jgi:hypothetical protein
MKQQTTNQETSTKVFDETYISILLLRTIITIIMTIMIIMVIMIITN